MFHRFHVAVLICGLQKGALDMCPDFINTTDSTIRTETFQPKCGRLLESTLFFHPKVEHKNPMNLARFSQYFIVPRCSRQHKELQNAMNSVCGIVPIPSGAVKASNRNFWYHLILVMESLSCLPESLLSVYSSESAR